MSEPLHDKSHPDAGLPDTDASPGRTARRLRIKDIEVPRGRRPAPVEAVTSVAESFAVIGQKTPISVGYSPSGPNEYFLITGKIRLEAAILLGWTHIDCFVELPDAVNAERWRLSENYYRFELTVLQRAEHHARLVELEAAKNGQVVEYSRRGRPRKGSTASSRIVPTPGKSDAANAKQAQRLLKISAIAEEAKEKARALGIDDIESDLLEVARAPDKETQVAKVTELASKKEKAKHLTKDVSALPQSVSPPTQPSGSEMGQKEHVEVLVATLDATAVRLLQTTWAEEDRVERSLPAHLGQVVSGGAVLVQGRVCDLPVIVNTFLPICGVELSRVLQVSPTTDRDITKMEVVVIAVRGGQKAKLFADGTPLPSEGPVQVLALAQSLFPDAKRKVHIFAAEQTEGWECVLRDQSWSEEPRVR